MHVVAYEDDGSRPAIGIRLEDGVLPTGHTDLTALIKAGPRELDRLRQASESPNQLIHPLRLRAPISPTSTLLLAGGNYADHLAETGLHPTELVFFSKLRSAVIGPDEPIRIPTRETHTDWEAELSIIIGKPAYRSTAMAYLGVTLVLVVVLSPLIIPVLVTVVHVVRTWRGRAGESSARQRGTQIHEAGLRQVQKRRKLAVGENL